MVHMQIKHGLCTNRAHKEICLPKRKSRYFAFPLKSVIFFHTGSLRETF